MEGIEAIEIEFQWIKMHFILHSEIENFQYLALWVSWVLKFVRFKRILCWQLVFHNRLILLCLICCRKQQMGN